jgi:hypothetical protein
VDLFGGSHGLVGRRDGLREEALRRTLFTFPDTDTCFARFGLGTPVVPFLLYYKQLSHKIMQAERHKGLFKNRP